jgi:hypothetical protein
MIKTSKCGKMQFRLIIRANLSISQESGEYRMLYEDIAAKLHVPPQEFNNREAKREIVLASLQSLSAATQGRS